LRSLADTGRSLWERVPEDVRSSEVIRPLMLKMHTIVTVPDGRFCMSFGLRFLIFEEQPNATQPQKTQCCEADCRIDVWSLMTSCDLQHSGRSPRRPGHPPGRARTGESTRVAIDLKNVLLIDRNVVRFIGNAEANGVELRNCPLMYANGSHERRPKRNRSHATINETLQRPASAETVLLCGGTVECASNQDVCGLRFVPRVSRRPYDRLAFDVLRSLIDC